MNPPPDGVHHIPINPTRRAMFVALTRIALQARRMPAGAGLSGARIGVRNDGAPPGAPWSG